MPRYVVIRPRAEYTDDVPVLTAQTVFEAEQATVETGLLDADGNRLGRVIKGDLGFDLKAR